MRSKGWIGIFLGAALLMLSACGATERDSVDDGGIAVADDEDMLSEEAEGRSESADAVPESREAAGDVSSEVDGMVGDAVPEADDTVGDAVSEGDKTGGDAMPEEGKMAENAADDIEKSGDKGSQQESGDSPSGEAAGDNDNSSAKTVRHAEQGMKLSILGDSISTFEGWIPEGNSDFYPQNGWVKDVSQTWWKIVLDEAGLTLCTNGSSSGSACFGYSQEDEPAFGCSDYRIAQLTGANGEVPDIIIVYMGTNDVLQSASLGDNDGRRAVAEGLVGSLSDGYTMILDKLEKQYPNAQIYCCTLLPIGDWGTDQPFVDFVNGQGLTSEAYADQIRTIAQNRGIPVIDLYHCGITLENMAEMTSDGVHLSPEGMRCVADTVLRSIVN